MLPYYVTIILVGIFSALAERERIETADGVCVDKQPSSYKTYVFLTSFVLIFVSGFRAWVGTDYGGYTTSFYTRAASCWEDLMNYKEPGLGILNWFLQKIWNDYTIMFIAVAAITCGLCISQFSKHSSMFFMSSLLFIFIGCWHGAFNGVRQYLAAAIMFAGHRYMFNRKFIKWCVVVFIASLFHTTALIMIPVYFLSGKKLSWYNIGLTAVATVVMRFSGDFLFRLVGYYKGEDIDTEHYTYFTSTVNPFRILVAFAPLVIALFMMDKAKRREPENAFYISMLVVNAAFMFATANSAYLARIGIYTDVYAALAFPRILDGLKDQKQKNTLKWVILILYFVFWWYEVWSRDSLNNFQWAFYRLF